MSEKIRECPFCGGQLRVQQAYPRPSDDMWEIRCAGYEGAGGKGCLFALSKTFGSEQEAVEAANHRPREERLVNLLREAYNTVPRDIRAAIKEELGAELGRET